MARTFTILLVLSVALQACTSDARETRIATIASLIATTDADSIASGLVLASGIEALDEAPAIRFTFGIEREDQLLRIAHHLYHVASGQYRVEWPADAPPDSMYVALFTEWPQTGAVYRNGTEVTTIAGRDALEFARGRSINDSYWLLAPLKVLDAGVNRVYVADSSTARHSVIRLSFEEVGLTPGDQYWLFIDRETGLLDRWTYLLQSGVGPTSFYWTDYQTLFLASGDSLLLSARKQSIDGQRAILTDHLELVDVDDVWFTEPRPRLTREVSGRHEVN